MGGWGIRYGNGCVDLGTEVTSASGVARPPPLKAVTTAARPASPEAVSLSSECEPCKDNVESVLGEKLPFEALRPAEKPMLDERLR